MADRLAAALEYAAVEVSTFPAWVSFEDGHKRVRPIAEWRKASTTNPETIRRWFEPGQPWAEASLCIDCGKSQLVVIDLDEGEGKAGLATWAALLAEHDPPRTAARARTPSGGEHWYYRESRYRIVGIDSSGKVGQDIDVRGLGGFVIAWPSEDARGAYGQVDLEALAAAPVVPDFVIERMRAQSVLAAPEALVAPAMAGPVAVTHVADDFWTSVAPERKFTREQARAFCMPPLETFRALQTPDDTGFNHKLNAVACIWSHFVPGFMTAAQAEEAIYAAAEANRSVEWQGEATVRGTIRSGLNQRTDPWKAVRVEEEPPADEPSQPDLRARMLARVYDRDQLDTIQPPTALIDGVLDVATLAMVAGKFGTYKTFTSTGWALSIATGSAWFGREVITTGPVLYVITEGASGFRRRVRAWEVANIDGRRVPADRFITYNGVVSLASAEQFDIFAGIAADIAPALIVFDTLHKCIPGLDEQGSVDMSQPLHRANQLREHLGATVLFCHHTGHNGERSRGSSALEDDIDTSWVSKLSGDQEDRSPDNQRVLTHRKAKDHELLDDIPLLLRAVDGTDSCVIEPAEADCRPGAEWLVTAALARKLDELGAPRQLTIKETKRYGEKAGLGRHSQAMWAGVARVRREPLRPREASDDDE